MPRFEEIHTDTTSIAVGIFVSAVIMIMPFIYSLSIIQKVSLALQIISRIQLWNSALEIITRAREIHFAPNSVYFSPKSLQSHCSFNVSPYIPEPSREPVFNCIKIVSIPSPSSNNISITHIGCMLACRTCHLERRALSSRTQYIRLNL